MTIGKSLETLGPIPQFLETGKPFQLVTQLIGCADERMRREIMTKTVKACATSVELKELTPDKAAKRVRTLIKMDDSHDHDRICLALEEADAENPEAVELIISNLSAQMLLKLDPTTGPSVELLIDYATPKQLATLARYYTGKIYAAKISEDRVSRRGESNFGIAEEALQSLKSSRVNDAARGLGRLLDLVVNRNDEDDDGFLELFAAALLKEEPVSLKKKTGKLAESSFMIDQIVGMADKRSSAARVIESLPEGDPDGWKAKLILRRNI